MARRRQRRRVRLWWIALLPIAALAAWLALNHYVFVIREVDVAGSGSVPAHEAVRLSGIRLGTRMNALDEALVESGVEEDGRLAFVSLEKHYPQSVTLNVRERTQDAMIVQAGKVLVLDSDGYVVSIGDHLPQATMPYVTGLRISGYQLGRQLDTADGRVYAMKAVLEGLKRVNGTGYVSELDVELLSDLRITTRTGMTVLLGNSNDMLNKLTWMTGALTDLEARGELLGRLDVSSGTKADFLRGERPAPAPTPTPLPEAQDLLSCEAGGCLKPAEYSIVGMSGKLEHYCYEHYMEVKATVEEVYGTSQTGGEGQ